MIATDALTVSHAAYRSTGNVAKDLLNINAIKFDFSNPYVWTSGIHSPIYCDNRLIPSFVSVRDTVVNAFTERIRTQFPETEIIAAVATGGIPLGSIIAMRLNLPFIYIRSKPKEYGLKKQIEGYYEEGNKIVLIEDHISTGKSSINAIEAIRGNGLDLLCLISIMTYNFKTAEDKYNQLNVPFQSICDLDEIIKTALEEGLITEDQKTELYRFRQSPETWYK